jgi:hypothetical protein
MNDLTAKQMLGNAKAREARRNAPRVRGWLWLAFAASLALFGAARCAHATDVLDVRIGVTTMRYEGTMLTRDERGASGSLYFIASTEAIRPQRPLGAASTAEAYDVVVIPATNSGVQEFIGEDCGLVSAEYEHTSGVLYMLVACAP